MAKVVHEFTGTVEWAGWRSGQIVDTYSIHLRPDNAPGMFVVLYGNDRLNIYPTAGERIRIAGTEQPNGEYRVAVLCSDEDGEPVVDWQSGMMIQAERL